jgi:hypothetical protein
MATFLPSMSVRSGKPGEVGLIAHPANEPGGLKAPPPRTSLRDSSIAGRRVGPSISYRW